MMFQSKVYRLALPRLADDRATEKLGRVFIDFTGANYWREELRGDSRCRLRVHDVGRAPAVDE